MLSRVPPILAGMIYLQTLIAAVHSIVGIFRKKKSNQVWHINLPNNQMNNNPFNAEIGDTRECIIALCLGAFPIFVKEFSIVQNVASYLSYSSYDDIKMFFNFIDRLAISIFLFIPPTLCFIKEKKVRHFTVKFSMCRFDDL